MEIKRPFSAAEWLKTPEAVRAYIEMLEQSILQLSQALTELKGRTEKLEQRVNRNSQNSNQPPSADGPFKKPERKKKEGKRKRGGQKGHSGHRQQLLDPTETVALKPSVCSCGSRQFRHIKAFFTHQQIELPEIELEVTHYVLYKGRCSSCGRQVTARLEPSQRAG